MKILQCVANLDPALGGCVEAPRLLTGALARLGHNVEVVTLEKLEPGWTDSWPAVVHWAGPAMGHYRYSKNLPGWLRAHAVEYDVLVVHGVWRYMSVGVWRALRKLRVPYVLYTHGMLDPFYNRFLKKRIKKLFHWKIVEHKVVRDAGRVIFTCAEEQRLASGNFSPFVCKPEILSLGIEAPPRENKISIELPWPEELEGKQVILFLARFEAQKGCDILIRAFAQIAARHPNVQLLMTGPDSLGWKSDLLRIADECGATGRITWHGPVFGDTKWNFFRKADVYILPTNFENFGISIVEALACGLPVLISKKAAIWREIEAAGAGFISDNTVEGTAEILERWLATSPEHRLAMRRNALRCFREHYEIGGVAERFSAMLETLLAREKQARLA